MLLREGLATTADSVLLRWELWGTNEHCKNRLLFINGTMCDMRRFTATYQAFVHQDCLVLSFDHRGMGRSTMDMDESHYTMETYAKDCVVVLDALEWDTCSVVGYSFGGMVAQHLCLQAPTRVSSAVFCCTSSGGRGGSSLDLLELAQKGDYKFFKGVVSNSHNGLKVR